MRRIVGQVQVPQCVCVSRKALHRVLDVFNKCWKFVYWPFFTALLLTVGVSPARADAAGSVSIPGAGWAATGISVTAGDVLTITASGQWVEGSTTSGPDGQAAAWADNFFNVYDLGVCNYCAVTRTPEQAALIAYLGEKPPAPGSYTSSNVLLEAMKIFGIGSGMQDVVPLSGRLWLGKNADAYSGYVNDNSGSVTVTTDAKPAGAGSSLPFDRAGLCFRNLLKSKQNDAAAAQAILSRDCVTMKIYELRVALDYCLLRFNSAKVCLLTPPGIPIIRN